MNKAKNTTYCTNHFRSLHEITLICAIPHCADEQHWWDEILVCLKKRTKRHSVLFFQELSLCSKQCSFQNGFTSKNKSVIILRKVRKCNLEFYHVFIVLNHLHIHTNFASAVTKHMFSRYPRKCFGARSSFVLRRQMLLIRARGNSVGNINFYFFTFKNALLFFFKLQPLVVFCSYGRTYPAFLLNFISIS